MVMRMKKLAVLHLLLAFTFYSSPPHAAAGDGQAERLRWLKANFPLAAASRPSSSSTIDRSACSTTTMEDDKITELPGQPSGVDFDQYSGYVTVDAKAGRALFYYFAESPEGSSSKPLVLWLNGGPGCSSFGFGAMEEIGPFRVNSDSKTLRRNPSAWNNVANVIFLESPAGVGFSYSNTTSDYEESGDTRTAEDTYVFLVNWLEMFPQYKGRDFYITGESYAGHYIPQLAAAIIDNNRTTVINLRGVAIGNGYIDSHLTDVGTSDFLWSHAIASDETYDKIRAACTAGRDDSAACIEARDEAKDEASTIDEYNIYAPLCGHNYNSNPSGGIYMADFDPCTDNYVRAYLNDPDVQMALHVYGVPNPWDFCVMALPWMDGPASMHPTIKKLISTGIRVWLYSGDVDSVVPITATRYSIRALGLPLKNPWAPYYDHNDQVGGYMVGYEGLTFATIRGAGHTAPSYQPERALTMISAFLQVKPHN